MLASSITLVVEKYHFFDYQHDKPMFLMKKRVCLQKWSKSMQRLIKSPRARIAYAVCNWDLQS
jgi:hypothetical protein